MAALTVVELIRETEGNILKLQEQLRLYRQAQQLETGANGVSLNSGPRPGVVEMCVVTLKKIPSRQAHPRELVPLIRQEFGFEANERTIGTLLNRAAKKGRDGFFKVKGQKNTFGLRQ